MTRCVSFIRYRPLSPDTPNSWAVVLFFAAQEATLVMQTLPDRHLPPLFLPQTRQHTVRMPTAIVYPIHRQTGEPLKFYRLFPLTETMPLNQSLICGPMLHCSKTYFYGFSLLPKRSNVGVQSHSFPYSTHPVSALMRL